MAGVLSRNGQPQGWDRTDLDARTVASPSLNHPVPYFALVVQEQMMKTLKARGTTFSLDL